MARQRRLASSSKCVKFYGIKTLVDTALVPGSGSVVFEYWDGDSWEAFNIMETEAENPHASNANAALQTTGSYHLRFDWRMKLDWAKNDPPSTGTNRFWIRIRVATGVTTAPILQQIKIHSNRTEINADGFIEYFGLGRPLNRIPFDVNNFSESPTAAPNDQSLYLSDNLVLGRTANSFQNTGTDTIGLAVFLPYDTDTSCPIRLLAGFTVDGGTANGTRVIKFTIYWNTSSRGDNIYRSEATAPSTSTGEQSTTFTYTVPASGNDKLVKGFIDLEIPSTKPLADSSTGEGDILWITVKRDPSDVQDTYTGDVNLVQLTPYYCKWSNGASIAALTA